MPQTIQPFARSIPFGPKTSRSSLNPYARLQKTMELNQEQGPLFTMFFGSPLSPCHVLCPPKSHCMSPFFVPTMISLSPTTIYRDPYFLHHALSYTPQIGFHKHRRSHSATLLSSPQLPNSIHHTTPKTQHHQRHAFPTRLPAPTPPSP